MTNHIEITYANGSKVITGPYTTLNDANHALLKLIRASRALDVGTDSEVTDAIIIPSKASNIAEGV